ncbi:MAG: hypothetical protein A2788_00015 [Candidatus Abawacabacteria bacterium RIFCSPHIGHO2_01_FULL_46_8]|uniref:SIMPL domain-containing protein n=1 Tax=Candidatus Abawacabacteria bacterium RIFCSPHIGHO2_01_FULL_46_8 TaxID=1817815 RepID=A0A1F4XJN0_9BACT|nr:MAG: hypothetical protein A2788_00015 [Candidatus Abawacabacteria bacterium RIFCSPHIGHO2_01_FULL_46_8]
MHAKVKNVLGVVLMIALLVVSLAVLKLAKSYQQAVQEEITSNFTVSGEGKVIAIPDIAEFSFSVTAEGKGLDISQLQLTNTQKADKLLSYLKELGINEKDIQTIDYSVQPRYQYFNCPSTGGSCPLPEIVGYTINKRYSVKIRDLAKVNDALSGVVERAADSVSGLSFTIDDPTQLQAEARLKAMAKAKAKAKQVADAAGVRIGKLISINEGFISPIPMYATRSLSMEAVGGGGIAPAVVEPGSQEIRVEVNLTYRIE